MPEQALRCLAVIGFLGALDNSIFDGNQDWWRHQPIRSNGQFQFSAVQAGLVEQSLGLESRFRLGNSDQRRGSHFTECKVELKKHLAVIAGPAEEDQVLPAFIDRLGKTGDVLA